MMCDFEMGLQNAVHEVFPRTDRAGCFYHLSANGRKKAVSLGLREKLQSDQAFLLESKKVLALAFVPPDHLDDAVRLLRQELPQDLLPLLRYFEDTYIG